MKVVNVKYETCTHYCGRKESYRGNGVDMSILGNPFKVKPWGEYERDESIARHRVWLNKQRLDQTEVWDALVSLPEDAVLGCFCKPEACHCDTIIDAWKYTKQENSSINN